MSLNQQTGNDSIAIEMLYLLLLMSNYIFPVRKENVHRVYFFCFTKNLQIFTVRS